jgi:hypothetical protein
MLGLVLPLLYFLFLPWWSFILRYDCSLSTSFSYKLRGKCPCILFIIIIIIIVMLMLFKYLIYVLNMREDINLMHFLLLFFWALNLLHLPWTLLFYEYPLGTSETFLCFMLVHPIKTVPPAGVQLQQIQFVINWMYTEGKLSHLGVILFYYIITRCSY